MTKTERIAALEAKVAALEARTTATEATAFRRLMQPVNPWWYGYPFTSPYQWTSLVGTVVGTISTGSTAAYGNASDNITYTNGTNMVSQ